MLFRSESLARFKQNEKFLFPLPFIKNFEKNGLIVDFDLKTIMYAAKFIKELNELKLIDDDFKLSVNLSSFTIDTLNYGEITKILNKYKINYEQILFEITERTTTEDKTFKEKLAKFNSFGLNLSMDDFSVGNSSLHLFYDINSVMILGRVTSGVGGDLILENARKIVELENPVFAESLEINLPNEQTRRVGQSIAAASLPVII